LKDFVNFGVFEDVGLFINDIFCYLVSHRINQNVPEIKIIREGNSPNYNEEM